MRPRSLGAEVAQPARVAHRATVPVGDRGRARRAHTRGHVGALGVRREQVHERPRRERGEREDHGRGEDRPHRARDAATEGQARGRRAAGEREHDQRDGLEDHEQHEQPAEAPGPCGERGPDRRGERRRKEQDGHVDRGIPDDQLKPHEDRGEDLDQGDQHRQRRGTKATEAAGAPGVRSRRPERLRRAAHHRA